MAWRKTIKLKDLLGEDESDEVVRDVARQIVARLRREPEFGNDDDFTSVVLEFEDVACEQSTGDDVFGGRFTLCDWFNAVLNSLYDWADADRVWIG